MSRQIAGTCFFPFFHQHGLRVPRAKVTIARITGKKKEKAQRQEVEVFSAAYKLLILFLLDLKKKHRG